MGLGCYDILMKQVKGMKFFVLVKLLHDDTKEKGMRYIYTYTLTLDVVKSCHMVANNGILSLEV